MIQMVRPNWSTPPSVHAGCTTRLDGNSLGPYAGLNLATQVGDAAEAVVLNRAALMQDLKLTTAPCWLSQTHSTRVAHLTGSQPCRIKADAAITTHANVVAVVLTADCLPILLCSRQGDEVAAIHAGWRGLANGVVQATLGNMQSSSDQLMAWIGPAISQHRFEVGAEVRHAFVQSHATAKHRFIAGLGGRWFCDLAGLAADLLRQQGLQDVHLSGLCSYDDQQFYSYRRHHITGRMASLIWIDPHT